MTDDTLSTDGRYARLCRRLPLWQQILVGLVLGTLVGSLLGERAAWLAPVGDLFINAIKMLIVPLVFSTLVVGITGMRDPQAMGRIGLRTVAIYLLTTAFAIALGLLLSTFIQPGTGVSMSMGGADAPAAQDAPGLSDILVGLVPTNPVAALTDGNILQIIVFAIALAIALAITGKPAEPVIRVFEGLAEAMITLTTFVMALAPIGVFALIAEVTGQYGADVLWPLAKVIGVMYLACVLQVLFVYSGIVALVMRLNPLRYLHGSLDALLVAFSSASSSGTLPVSLRCAENNLGVPRSIAAFVLPVGATINMDGTAIYQGVVAVFVAQLVGVDLSWTDYGMIVLTGTLASIGTAGVPGAGLIMLSIVLAQVGLPLAAVGVIAGIDRILDMARTGVNVAGDLMVTTWVAVSENTVDRGVYNGRRSSA